jgi:hypothetical protein
MIITAGDVTAQQAAQQIAHLNTGRRLPPILNRIRQLMKEESFSICNVGPWPHTMERGNLRMGIAAYDPAKHKCGYAKSDPLPVIRREAKVGYGDEYETFDDDGHAVANDLIGVGTGLHAWNSLLKYGVFVPAGLEPTPEEIAEARQRLSAYYDELITEARDAYDSGDPKLRQATIGPRHLLAARIRGLDEPWVRHQHTEEAVRCKMCGKFNPSGVAKCVCGQILDIELYRKLMAEQEEMLTAPKPKK